MDLTAIITSLLTLLAGIGVFLIACQMMSSNLEAASSEKLKKLFSKASGSKLMGVGIGALGTAAIQSSGATTVMTIGFVNAGIISLAQAATIIYGANIGTTVTAQIVALGMFGGNSVSTSVIFSAFAGLGAFLSIFAKKSGSKTLGGILAGFGLLFVGLELMSGSMEAFAALDGVKTFLSGIGNPVLLVLLGAVFTAVIQSSSVMTSIALAMVVTGLIGIDQGIFLTMGSNIGSCVVAVIAGVTSGTNAKRTALIHLLFNCTGVVLFMLAAMVLGWFDISYGSLFEKLFPSALQVQLAMFHTFFNTATVAMMLPLTGALVGLVTRMIPERTIQQDAEFSLHYVDEHMLRTPPVAVSQVKREILRMADIAMENVDRALYMAVELDFAGKGAFERDERQLNFINRELVNYVVVLSGRSGLGEKDKAYLSGTYRNIRDLERIGDYAENIVEYATALADSAQQFSDDAKYEISQLKTLLHQLYANALDAYQNESLLSLDQANVFEEEIDDYTKRMEEWHIDRMEKGICTPSVGAQYLELSSNAERIADHLINIAKSIKSL
ncbi:MAG: Na/Pi cotransporter family protein [Bacteroidales bacterium]|nr:Na/Pi cotransporter family protein [Bacteroidales bacterium]MBR1783633.1 Na/Pi cotransporter family protein [Bacteroidales bacterium]